MKSKLLIFLIIYMLILVLFTVKRLRLGNSIKSAIKHAETLLEANSSDQIFILMPVCDRVEYLKQVINSLDACEAIDQAILVVSIDCQSTQIKKILSARDNTVVIRHFPPYESLPSLFINNEYKTAANILFLLEFAFDYMDRRDAIVLESDIVPSIDFIKFHRWALNSTRNDETIMNINGYSHSSDPKSSPYAMKHDGFSPWGWSCTRHQFKKHIQPHWTSLNNWDFTLENFRKKSGLKSLTPLVSRTRNIGMKGINFNVDADIANRFKSVYIPKKAIDYENKNMILV